MKHSIFSLTPLCAALAMASAPSAAVQYWDITLPDGRPFVTLEVYGEGERYEFNDGTQYSGVSDWTLTQADKVSVYRGFDYLGRLLQASVNAPSFILIETYDAYDDNAAAYSPAYQEGPYAGYTYLGAELIYGALPVTGTSAFIELDHASADDGLWYDGVMHNLPANDERSDLASTVLHEMVHALGLTAFVDYAHTEDNEVQFVTKEENKYALTEFISCHPLWVAGIRDTDGTAPAPGMLITPYAGSDQAGPDTFDLATGRAGASGVYFTGRHVQEVLNGAEIAIADRPDLDPLPGIPVNGWEPDGSDSLIPELSHIELQNSLMSHQSWRNWNTLMEAELAILQDVGYTIDRRDWYGYSVYNSGVTLVNSHPFYARNEAGTAYLTGMANTNPWGVGLHLYGSHNDITQVGEILTTGDYAIGVRVDGWDNTLRIAPGTRVSSDGEEGYGLVVSYGTGHRVIHQGLLTATGEQGVAAVFSFGDNELGNNFEVRGSYIHQTGNFDENGRVTGEMYDESPEDINLAGALVENFDVSGSLVGGLASLFIDDNALVSNINILNGAYLQGDIISLWDPTDDRVQVPEGVSATSLVTQLTFGLAKNADGSANSETADPQFNLAYHGNIYALPAKQEQTPGWAKIQMRVAGGTLSFNGTAKLLSVTVDEGATLKGNATYDLTVLQSPETNEIEIGGDFINRGTLAPGNSLGQITVNGNLVLASTGRLLMEFDADGKTDQLLIQGSIAALSEDNVEDLDTLTGDQVTLQPVEDYYGTGTLTVDLSHMIQKANGDDEESTTSVSLEPTIQGDVSATLTQSGSVADNVLTLHTTRASDAYSRLAQSKEAAAVAAAFARHAGNAQGAMQDLVATIDFSEASTLNAAFESLSPDLYARAGAAALTAQQIITQAVLREQVKGVPHDASLYVVPLGGHTDRTREGFKSTYGGVLAGVQNQSALSSGTLTYGAHTAVLTRKDKFSVMPGSRVDADSFYLGANVRYDVNAFAGTYVFGLAQIAVENADMRRTVMQGFDYADSDWTGWGGSFVAGAGQRYALTERLTLGPVFWLNYGFMHQDSLTETASHGAALYVESETYQTLTSTLGVHADYTLSADTVKASVGGLLAWKHEYLDERGTANASFAASGWRDSRFGVTQETQTRDTATAAVSISAKLKENFTASIGAGSDFGDGQTSGWGYVNLKWSF